jgi:predicted dehydrogenase
MHNIKVSVIGCGYWGKNLVRNFAQLGALYSVCGANQDLATKASQDYGVPINTLDQLLQSDVNGVVIAAPAAQHYTLTKQAL